ncbi:hypothetical protein [Streptomyces sp. NBC_01483]|uniref:hypothetical protein n=1 Tax=Streptomyces sp. NBC_01483 TaxID=2903883 RepID=UPI002E332777|nr:hypothetical protein [Streptomyces sp. NBC_01483]
MARIRPFAQRVAISFAAAALGMTLTSLVAQRALPSIAEVGGFLIVALVLIAVIAPVARHRVKPG